MTFQITRVVIGIQVMFAGIDLPAAYLRREARSLFMLLGPIMTAGWFISAGFILLFIKDITFLEALAISACITPTDPILANAIVKGRYAEKHVPKAVRDIISAESGANDGLGFPFLFIALNLMQRSNHGRDIGQSIAHWVVTTWLYQIFMSCAIGAVIGFLAAKTLKFCHARQLVDHESFLAYGVGLALFTLGVVGILGSDDILACFVAGNSLTWHDFYRIEKHEHEDTFQDGASLPLPLSLSSLSSCTLQTADDASLRRQSSTACSTRRRSSTSARSSPVRLSLVPLGALTSSHRTDSSDIVQGPSFRASTSSRGASSFSPSASSSSAACRPCCSCTGTSRRSKGSRRVSLPAGASLLSLPRLARTLTDPLERPQVRPDRRLGTLCVALVPRPGLAPVADLRYLPADYAEVIFPVVIFMAMSSTIVHVRLSPSPPFLSHAVARTHALTRPRPRTSQGITIPLAKAPLAIARTKSSFSAKNDDNAPSWWRRRAINEATNSGGTPSAGTPGPASRAASRRPSFDGSASASVDGSVDGEQHEHDGSHEGVVKGSSAPKMAVAPGTAPVSLSSGSRTEVGRQDHAATGGGGEGAEQGKERRVTYALPDEVPNGF